MGMIETKKTTAFFLNRGDQFIKDDVHYVCTGKSKDTLVYGTCVTDKNKLIDLFPNNEVNLINQ